MSPQAKAAMYAANKKVMLGEEEKLEKNSGKEDKMEQYNIQKAQFEKELKEKKEKELTK